MLRLVPYGDSDDDSSQVDDDAQVETNKDHLGRVRNFPHVEGNYATHVYITVPAPKHVRKALLQLTQQLKPLLDGLHPVLDSVGQKRALPSAQSAVQDSYHLSLSRTVPIKFDQIDPLVGALHTHLTGTHSFTLKMGRPKVFINDQHTRTFLALGLQAGAEQVCELIRKVDNAFQHHKLLKFHEDPDPHVSIAWMAGYAVEAMQAALQQLGVGAVQQQQQQQSQPHESQNHSQPPLQQQQQQQHQSPQHSQQHQRPPHGQQQQPDGPRPHHDHNQQPQQHHQSHQRQQPALHESRQSHNHHHHHRRHHLEQQEQLQPCQHQQMQQLQLHNEGYGEEGKVKQDADSRAAGAAPQGASGAEADRTCTQEKPLAQASAATPQFLQVPWSCKVHEVVCRVGQRDHVVWSVAAGGVW